MRKFLNVALVFATLSFVTSKTFALPALASEMCAELFKTEKPVQERFSEGFLSNLTGQTTKPVEIVTTLIEANQDILRQRNLSDASGALSPLTQSDIAMIAENALTARQLKMGLVAEISHKRVIISPHVFDVASSIISASRRDGRQGVSNTAATTWLRESIEAAAFENQSLTPDILILTLNEKFRRNLLPNLTAEDVTELTANLAFRKIMPLTSDDAWFILRQSKITGQKVFNLGGLSAIARAARNGKGNDELKQAADVLRHGFLTFGYAESELTHVFIGLELQQDFARAYFRSKERVVVPATATTSAETPKALSLPPLPNPPAYKFHTPMLPKSAPIEAKTETKIRSLTDGLLEPTINIQLMLMALQTDLRRSPTAKERSVSKIIPIAELRQFATAMTTAEGKIPTLYIQLGSKPVPVSTEAWLFAANHLITARKTNSQVPSYSEIVTWFTNAAVHATNEGVPVSSAHLTQALTDKILARIASIQADTTKALNAAGLNAFNISREFGYTLIARSHRTRRGTDDVLKIGDILADGLRKLDYDDAAIKDAMLMLEVGPDIVRAHHRRQ